MLRSKSKLKVVTPNDIVSNEIIILTTDEEVVLPDVNREYVCTRADGIDSATLR